MNLPENALNGWLVIVIDDEPDSAEVATLLLQMQGATVVTATNGREGLEAVKNYKPRFIISDLSMPEMSGWELTEALKANDRSISTIPIVALTAHAMTGDRNRALVMGFHHFMTKPIRPESFIQELFMMLADDLPELRKLLSSE